MEQTAAIPMTVQLGSSEKDRAAAADVAGFTGGEIWVKAGIYPEQITLRCYASLYGGIRGNESTRNAGTRLSYDDTRCRGIGE